jgi:2-dehydro-3-deoxygluconokinase
VSAVLTLGECMVLLTNPATGPLRHARTLDVSVGGSEANVAIGLARAGVPVSWVGRVGDDEFGQLVLRTLRAEGVDVSAARTDPDAPTGLMFRERRTADTSRVLYRRSGSAGSRLGVADIPAGTVAAAALLHVTGITPALGARPREAVRHAVTAARAAGTPVSLDVNMRRTLWSQDEAAGELRWLARRADIVFCGLADGPVLAGPTGSAAELAGRIAALGPRDVLVTQGSAGAYYLAGGRPVSVPARTATVADPVGAGDAFAAGFLGAYVQGLPPRARLERAQLCGALAVGVHGDWEGLPTARELAAWTDADVQR